MLEDRIIVDQEVAHGKPIIRGSRVSVEIVLGSLAGGLEIEKWVRSTDWRGKAR